MAESIKTKTYKGRLKLLNDSFNMTYSSGQSYEQMFFPFLPYQKHKDFCGGYLTSFNTCVDSEHRYEHRHGQYNAILTDLMYTDEYIEEERERGYPLEERGYKYMLACTTEELNMLDNLHAYKGIVPVEGDEYEYYNQRAANEYRGYKSYTDNYGENAAYPTAFGSSFIKDEETYLILHATNCLRIRNKNTQEVLEDKSILEYVCWLMKWYPEKKQFRFVKVLENSPIKLDETESNEVDNFYQHLASVYIDTNMNCLVSFVGEIGKTNDDKKYNEQTYMVKFDTETMDFSTNQVVEIINSNGWQSDKNLLKSNFDTYPDELALIEFANACLYETSDMWFVSPQIFHNGRMSAGLKGSNLSFYWNRKYGSSAVYSVEKIKLKDYIDGKRQYDYERTILAQSEGCTFQPFDELHKLIRPKVEHDKEYVFTSPIFFERDNYYYILAVDVVKHDGYNADSQKRVIRYNRMKVNDFNPKGENFTDEPIVIEEPLESYNYPLENKNYMYIPSIDNYDFKHGNEVIVPGYVRYMDNFDKIIVQSSEMFVEDVHDTKMDNKEAWSLLVIDPKTMTTEMACYKTFEQTQYDFEVSNLSWSPDIASPYEIEVYGHIHEDHSSRPDEYPRPQLCTYYNVVIDDTRDRYVIPFVKNDENDHLLVQLANRVINDDTDFDLYFDIENDTFHEHQPIQVQYIHKFNSKGSMTTGDIFNQVTFRAEYIPYRSNEYMTASIKQLEVRVDNLDTQPKVSSYANSYEYTLPRLYQDNYLKTYHAVLETGNTVPFTPTGDFNPATKLYVDQSSIHYYEVVGISDTDLNTQENEEILANLMADVKAGNKYMFVLKTGSNENEHTNFYPVEVRILSGGTDSEWLDIWLGTQVSSVVNTHPYHWAESYRLTYHPNYSSKKISIAINDWKLYGFHKEETIKKVYTYDNTNAFTPTGDYNLVPKKYVDDNFFPILGKYTYELYSGSDDPDINMGSITSYSNKSKDMAHVILEIARAGNIETINKTGVIYMQRAGAVYGVNDAWEPLFVYKGEDDRDGHHCPDLIWYIDGATMYDYRIEYGNNRYYINMFQYELSELSSIKNKVSSSELGFSNRRIFVRIPYEGEEPKTLEDTVKLIAESNRGDLQISNYTLGLVCLSFEDMAHFDKPPKYFYGQIFQDAEENIKMLILYGSEGYTIDLEPLGEHNTDVLKPIGTYAPLSKSIKPASEEYVDNSGVKTFILKNKSGRDNYNSDENKAIFAEVLQLINEDKPFELIANYDNTSFYKLTRYWASHGQWKVANPSFTFTYYFGYSNSSNGDSGHGYTTLNLTLYSDDDWVTIKEIKGNETSVSIPTTTPYNNMLLTELDLTKRYLSGNYIFKDKCSVKLDNNTTIDVAPGTTMNIARDTKQQILYYTITDPTGFIRSGGNDKNGDPIEDSSKLLDLNVVLDALTPTNEKEYEVSGEFVPAHKQYVDKGIKDVNDKIGDISIILSTLVTVEEDKEEEEEVE